MLFICLSKPFFTYIDYVSGQCINLSWEGWSWVFIDLHGFLQPTLVSLHIDIYIFSYPPVV